MPTPVRKKVSDIKSQFLNPALTSHFECRFTPPESVVNWIKESSNAGLGLPWTGNEEFFSIACIDASLPGSSLMTHEQNNDFHGITERHAYRRDYGSGLDFTFLVDTNHYLLFFFENWIRYIVNERPGGDVSYPGVEDYTKSYTRVNYPNNYISRDGIYINKFERDYESSLGIAYKFLNAYPISITSMPVSYEASQLLKCTVTFTYTRYVAKPLLATSMTDDVFLPQQPNGSPSEQGSGINRNQAIWALSNRRMIQNRNRAPVNLSTQDEILRRAELEFPVGSPQRTQLLQEARRYDSSVSF